MDDRLLVVETERLILRGDLPGDLEPAVDLWTDPSVMKYMGGPRDRAKLIPAVEEGIEAGKRETHALWNLVKKEGEEYCGNAGLIKKEVEGRNEVELIYMLFPAHQGFGFATEIGKALCEHAATELGHQRLIALIHPENAPSRRVVERLGFQMEQLVERSGKNLELHTKELKPGGPKTEES